MLQKVLDRIEYADNGCWVWRGGTAGTTRYGAIRLPGTSKKQYVHRYSYEFHKGPIADGLEVDHLCRNRLCLNPDHLEAVTPIENRLRTRLKTCPRGHDLTDPKMVRWDPQGRRRGCAQCKRDTALAYFYAHRDTKTKGV